MVVRLAYPRGLARPRGPTRLAFDPQAGAYLPGVLLCIAVTLFAALLQAIEVGIAGEPYIEALVLAIVLGVAIRTASSSDFWPSLRRLPPA